MTIRQQGGIFGRNPTLNNVTVDGILTVDQIVEKTSAAGITLDGVKLKDGNVVLASGNGIDFSATSGTGTSELFDDYEEGTWTPTLTTDGTDFDSVTYDALTAGVYTKVGNLVSCAGRLRTDAVTVGSGTGNVAIGGLPFAANSAPQARTALTIGNVASWTTNHPSSGRIVQSGTTCLLTYRSAANGATSLIQTSDVGTGANANDTYFSLFYYV